MATFNEISKLVNGLSKSERKHYTSYTGGNVKPSRHFFLFNLITEYPFEYKMVNEMFLHRFPTSSFPSTLNNLYENLLDFLVFFNREEDMESNIIFRIMRTITLFNRSLTEGCFHSLEKLRHDCKKAEMYHWLTIIDRLELSYRMQTDYQNINEEDLMQLHASLNKGLRYLQTVADHQLQFDLLNLRLQQMKSEGRLKSESPFDDLAINELNIFSNPRYSSFEAEKLHLLFQSEYFMARSDLKVSLRIFREMNTLFEKNRHLWQNPPLLYISHLSGIIRNLQYLNTYREMDIYLEKLNELSKLYPKADSYIQSVYWHYQIQKALGEQDLKLIQSFIPEIEQFLLKPHAVIRTEPTNRLRLSLAAGYFFLGLFKNSLKHVNLLIKDRFSPSDPFEYAVRMAYILNHFELGNDSLVEKEIRSFRRYSKMRTIRDHGEAQLFRILLGCSAHNRQELKAAAKKLQATLRKMQNENELNPGRIYFNLMDWVEWVNRQ